MFACVPTIKTLAVDLKRFPAPSRNRYWVVFVANVGEGKSTATARMVALLQDVLAKDPHLWPGLLAERFHYQQRSTSASGRDKLRACVGYFTVYSDEAVLCLCLSPKYAGGGENGPYKHIDLCSLLPGTACCHLPWPRAFDPFSEDESDEDDGAVPCTLTFTRTLEAVGSCSTGRWALPYLERQGAKGGGTSRQIMMVFVLLPMVSGPD